MDKASSLVSSGNYLFARNPTHRAAVDLGAIEPHERPIAG